MWVVDLTVRNGSRNARGNDALRRRFPRWRRDEAGNKISAEFPAYVRVCAAVKRRKIVEHSERRKPCVCLCGSWPSFRDTRGTRDDAWTPLRGSRAIATIARLHRRLVVFHHLSTIYRTLERGGIEIRSGSIDRVVVDQCTDRFRRFLDPWCFVFGLRYVRASHLVGETPSDRSNLEWNIYEQGETTSLSKVCLSLLFLFLSLEIKICDSIE